MLTKQIKPANEVNQAKTGKQTKQRNTVLGAIAVIILGLAAACGLMYVTKSGRFNQPNIPSVSGWNCEWDEDEDKNDSNNS